MQQRALKGRLVQHEQAEKHVADLRHAGIGQALFEHRDLEGHHRAHEHRNQRQHNQRRLHPRAAQEVRAGHVEDHADDAQNARLGNHAAEHRAGRGRSDGVGRGQPAVHGEHTGLGAKADHRDEQHPQKQRALRGHGIRRERAAGNEQGGHRVGGKEEDAQQTHHRARDGVQQVFHARRHGFLGQAVQNQRHGQEGHQLKAQVHRHQRTREAQPQKRAQGEQVEGVEPPLRALVGHVAEAERAGEQPHAAHQDAEQPRQAVGGRHHRQVLGDGKQGQAAIAGQAQGHGEQKARHQGSQHKAVTRLVRPQRGHKPAQKRAQRGKQRGQNQQDRLHLDILLTQTS